MGDKDFDMQEALLVDRLEFLDDTFLSDLRQRILDGDVEPALKHLMDLLFQKRSECLSDQEWQDLVKYCRLHPIRELLHEDPFTARAYKKPRGYAGDAVLIDFLYGVEEDWPVPPDTTELGARIFRYTTRHMPATEAVRYRRFKVANKLDELCEQRTNPAVFSIACGHFREAILSAAVRRKLFGRICLLDSDAESLALIDETYSRFGVELIPASIRTLVAKEGQLEEQYNLREGFDLVYSMGLFDYVRDLTGQRLLRRMFEMLRPGGELLIANFLPEIRDVAYMETFMDWFLIYRSRWEVMELTKSIPEAEIRNINCFSEENKNIVFLQVTKN